MNASSSVFPRVSALIEQGIRDGLHLGAQLFVAQEGQVVGDEAYGEEQPDHPMHSETILLWMSSVKPVTAVALLQLMEEGLFDIDEPVASVIPEFGVGGKATITTRHLLTHTGGFRSADVEWMDESWDEAVSRVCGSSIEAGWTPGVRAGYHVESSWWVLGELIQRITGQTFGEYIHQRIFGPCGMTRSWIGLPADVLERESELIGRMYVVKQGELTGHPFANTEAGRCHTRPAGNGRGPMHELGRFYEDMMAGWLRDESRLLKQATIRQATSRAREGLMDETFRHKMDWGLGFMPNNQRYGVETVPYGFGRHASDTAFGHGGAQSSVAFADPEHQLVIALAFNGMPGEPRHQKRVRNILSALYEDLGLRSGT